ncbi:MAG: phosphatase PAP2 family protein [Verrucomicrobiales bacterium]
MSVLLSGIVTVAGFLASAALMMGGHTKAFDEWAVRKLRNPEDLADPKGPAYVEEAIRDITALGGTTVLTLMAVLVSTYFWIKRDRLNLMFVAGGYAGALILNHVLKALFARPRPEVVAHHLESYSFPSGHSLLATSVYLILGTIIAKSARGWRDRIFALGVAFLITFLVGASRVYLGVHYPTDVLAGWLAGLLWAMCCWRGMGWMEKRSFHGGNPQS